MTDILIVDDHAVVRKGIRQLLIDSSLFDVFDEAESGREAIRKVINGDYKLVLLDVALPDENGFKVLSTIKKEKPGLPVLMLSMYGEENYGIRAKGAGAEGYITKDETPDKLVDAISRVLAGGTYFAGTIDEQVIAVKNNHSHIPPHNRLSHREFEIMLLLAKGKRVKDIALELCISIKTVSTHRMHILEKMSMEDNAALTAYAILEGLVK